MEKLKSLHFYYKNAENVTSKSYLAGRRMRSVTVEIE